MIYVHRVFDIDTNFPLKRFCILLPAIFKRSEGFLELFYSVFCVFYSSFVFVLEPKICIIAIIF